MRLHDPEPDRPDQPLPGRQPSFPDLVDRHAQELFALAHSMLGNAADAEEAVQETFLGAFRGLGSFKGRASPRTWLTSILVRQVARVRRAHARRRTIPLARAGDELAAAPAASADAHDLNSLLSRLTPEHRDVIVLRELRRLSYEEIALVLGVPRGTVESRLHRARESLRNLVAEPPARPRGMEPEK